MNTKVVIGIATIIVILQIIVIGYFAYHILGERLGQKSTVQPEFAAEVPNDFDRATELIDGLNSAVAEQINNLPESLVQELANSAIYFMLTNKGDNHEELLTQAYVFENGAFSSPETKDTDVGDLYYTFSRDARYGAFTVLPGHLRDTGASASVRVFHTSSLVGPFPLLAQSVVVDDSPISRKQHPAVSNQGEVLFVGWDGHSRPAIEPANDWSIYKVVAGKAQYLTYGFMPKWVTDTEFVFLRDDGLYKADIDLTNVQQIASTTLRAFNNNRIDVSTDGNSVVWMQPERGTLILFEKTDQGFEQTHVFEMNGFWTAFSPSGKYIAVQTINKDATGFEEMPGAKVVFYSLETKNIVEEFEIDLDAFDQQSMFMTDWVTRK